MTIPKKLVDHPQIVAQLQQLTSTGAWSQYEGPCLSELQRYLAEYHRREHVQLCASGTVAIELALRGLQVGAGDEVVLAGYDFPGNFRAIECVGARPVLVDIAPNSWSMDVDRVREAYTPSVKAIIASHLHGTMVDMPKLMAWAREHRVPVIEDACQSHGASIHGVVAGGWGDISVLSFGGSKLISGGRGGAILTQDPRYDQRMRIYRERGNDAYPMSVLQACVIRPQWDDLVQENAERWEVINDWESRLGSYAGLKIAQREGSTFPAFYKWGFQWMPEHSEADGMRMQLLQALQREGIECGEGFRGFVQRSAQRCRVAGTLTQSQQASRSTIVVHHTAIAREVDVPGILSKVLQSFR